MKKYDRIGEPQKKQKKMKDTEQYDLMEYGDEFNDEEERRYAKETYGNGEFKEEEK